MGKDTDIQWCDSTVNPNTGCDGCELWHAIDKGPCYAGVLHEGRLARSLPRLYAPSFTEVRMVPGRMAVAAGWSDLAGKARPGKPWLDGMPRTIFVGDMGDIFSKAVTFEFIADEVMGAAASAKGRRHIWMLLTKRPSRVVEFADWYDAESGGEDWPPNIWVGTSVTNQATAKRIDHLLKIRGVVRFVSFEPLREAVRFVGATTPVQSEVGNPIHLAIVGGESRQGQHEPTPFDVQWARDLVAQCRRVGISPFVKQLGSAPFDSARPRNWTNVTSENSHYCGVPLEDSHGGDWSEWSPDLRVRELPRVGQAVPS